MLWVWGSEVVGKWLEKVIRLVVVVEGKVYDLELIDGEVRIVYVFLYIYVVIINWYLYFILGDSKWDLWIDI